MEIHPKITGIDVSGLGGIWLFLFTAPKAAIIDTGPYKPLSLPPEILAKIFGHEPPGKGESAETAGSTGEQTIPVVKYSAPVLEKLGMTLADIKLILNTHIHFDHTGGNAAVKNASNGEILIHADDAIYFEKPELLFQRELAPIIELALGKDHLGEELEAYMDDEKTGPGPYAAVDRQLQDDDIIDLGEGYELKVIHLPGHTPGSVGYYWEAERILFAGDAMQGVCGQGGGLPIISDVAAYEKSLIRALNMPLDVMIHAHPFLGLTIPRTIVLRGEQITQYLEECLEFIRMLREAAKSAARDISKKPFSDLYDEVIVKLPADIGLNKTNEMPRQFFSAATVLNCIMQIEQ